jgi:hypothetical protein
MKKNIKRFLAFLLTLIAAFKVFDIVDARRYRKRQKQNMKAPVFGVTHSVKDH